MKFFDFTLSEQFGAKARLNLNALRTNKFMP